VIVALVFLVVLRAPEKRDPNDDAARNWVSVQDLSADFPNMLRLVQHDGALYAAKRTGVLEKGESPEDRFMTRDLAATYAWAILGVVTSLAPDVDSDAAAERLFKKWTSLANTTDEMYALWQLYFASQLSSDEEQKRKYYGWFWGRVKLQQKNIPRLVGANRLSGAEPMLLATLARQLTSAAVSLQDDMYIGYLKQLNQIHHEAAAASLAKQYEDSAQQIIDILHERIVAKDKAEPFLVESVSLPQFYCWGIWAEYGLYLANHDDALKAHILDNLRKVGLGERNADRFYFGTLQSLLPCTEVMLQSGDLEFKDRAKRVFEQFIVPSWDSNSHTLCSGSGGFLATPIGSHDRDDLCAGNTKFLSDSAWLTYQLGFFEIDTGFHDSTSKN
jgi:hypothetical protein